MYNLVVFSLFTELCNHHLLRNSRIFSSPSKETPYSLEVTPQPPSPPAPGNHSSLSVSLDSGQFRLVESHNRWSSAPRFSLRSMSSSLLKMDQYLVPFYYHVTPLLGDFAQRRGELSLETDAAYGVLIFYCGQMWEDWRRWGRWSACSCRVWMWRQVQAWLASRTRESRESQESQGCPAALLRAPCCTALGLCGRWSLSGGVLARWRRCSAPVPRRSGLGGSGVTLDVVGPVWALHGRVSGCAVGCTCNPSGLR